MNALTLHLQGPMMSFGDTGFGQLRGSGDFPNRSVVLGIVAAARGIRRNDERLCDLHAHCRVHVAAVRRGSPGVDYHIVRPFSGYQEESLYLHRPPVEDVSSVITYREYLHDAHFIALVEADDDYDMAGYKAHLRNPVFVSYLGRRSCPPATPLLPGEVREHTYTGAFNTALAEWQQHNDESGARTPAHMEVWLDAAEAPEELPVLARSFRRDLLLALPRTYVNRPVIHTRIIPTRHTNLSTNQEYFDAVP